MGLAGAVRPVAAQSGPAGEIVSLVNGLRAAEGVPPYTVDPALIASAQRQADWNAANGFSSHTGEGGTTPNDRALAAGYGGGLREWATENTAQGTLPYVNPQWVVTLWQGDAVHLRAMLSPDFENVGVGYAEANGEAFYTLVAGWVADEPPRPLLRPRLPTRQRPNPPGKPSLPNPRPRRSYWRRRARTVPSCIRCRRDSRSG